MDRWDITFCDGTTFSSDDGDWADVPPNEVEKMVVTRHRNGKPYSRILRGFSHYYFRDVHGVWEFGVWAHPDAATTPPGVPAGERVVWRPESEELVFDQPGLPGWAKPRTSWGPPWPWER